MVFMQCAEEFSITSIVPKQIMMMRLALIMKCNPLLSTPFLQHVSAQKVHGLICACIDGPSSGAEVIHGANVDVRIDSIRENTKAVRCF
jgi:hypothetical protein